MLENSTDDDVDLSGKFMRFLKDSECNNGTNHSTDDAGDCRAKVPIHIPSKFGWNSISCIILLIGLCICGFLFIVLEDKFQRSIFFAIIIVLAVLISRTDILLRIHRRLFIRVISAVCIIFLSALLCEALSEQWRSQIDNSGGEYSYIYVHKPL